MKALNKISSLADYFEIKLAQEQAQPVNQINSILINKFSLFGDFIDKTYLSVKYTPEQLFNEKIQDHLEFATSMHQLSEKIVNELINNPKDSLDEALIYISSECHSQINSLALVDSFINTTKNTLSAQKRSL